MEPLVEPLTERELEVLRLVVAVSTVKSHVNRISGKLGVENRTQAEIKAPELALLQLSLVGSCSVSTTDIGGVQDGTR